MSGRGEREGHPRLLETVFPQLWGQETELASSVISMAGTLETRRSGQASHQKQGSLYGDFVVVGVVGHLAVVLSSELWAVLGDYPWVIALLVCLFTF